MNDRYEYVKIGEHSKAAAIQELNENPLQVNAHIDSFRRWVKSIPHIKCPTNTKFLLRFLRVSKFNHEKAQIRLDNFCTVRSSTKGSPEFFKFFNIDDEAVQSFLKLKMHVPLGQNDAGEIVFLIRTSVWDPDKIPLTKLIVLIFMGLDILINEEESQIHGIKILIDLIDISRKSMEAWIEPKLLKQWHKIIQESYPIRLKGQIFYNEPKLFDIVFDIISIFMNEKIKNRTFRIKNDIRKAIEKIPGLERILPTEYNGHGGTLDECAERWKIKFEDYFKNGNPLQCISVDESKRPKTNSHFSDAGTTGIFTKFDDVF